MKWRNKDAQEAVSRGARLQAFKSIEENHSNRTLASFVVANILQPATGRYLSDVSSNATAPPFDFARTVLSSGLPADARPSKRELSDS